MSPSAGVNNQTSNSIILNATGSILDVSGTTSSGFYVAPVRHYTSSASNTGTPAPPFCYVYYNPNTGEFVYSNTL